MGEYSEIVDENIDLQPTGDSEDAPPSRTRIKSCVLPPEEEVHLTEHPYNQLAVQELYTTVVLPGIHDRMRGAKSGDLALVRMKNVSDKPITVLNPKNYVEGEKASTLGKWELQEVMRELVGVEDAQKISSLSVLRDAKTRIHEVVEPGAEVVMSKFAMAVSLFVYSRMTATYGGHIAVDNRSTLAEGSRFCVKFTQSGAAKPNKREEDAPNFLNSSIDSSAFWVGRSMGQRYKTIHNGGMVDVSLNAKDHSLEMTWLAFNASPDNPYKYTRHKENVKWVDVAYDYGLVDRFTHFYAGAGAAVKKTVQHTRTSVMETKVHPDYWGLSEAF